MSVNRKTTNTANTVPISPSRRSWVLHCVIICSALFGAYLHCSHVSQLHENDLFYSHLSSKERELTFRTESGFYYSFYKQMLLAPDFRTAWYSLMNDSRSEVPRCFAQRNSADWNCPPLNAMERFNLYPELILSGLYRLLNRSTIFHRMLYQDCYQVNRDAPSGAIGLAVDPDLLPMASNNESVKLLANTPITLSEQYVLSCVGPGEPSYFYINAVFFLSGLIPFALTWSGWFLTSSPDPKPSWLSLWSLVLPVAAYFYNHREATRVQWVPALRENFAYPFFILQQSGLLYMLTRSTSKKIISASALTVHLVLLLCFQLPWQFAQFALATQVASLFAALCLSVTTSREPSSLPIARIQWIILMHIVALILSTVFQFGNRLLLTSGYLAGLLGVIIGSVVLKKRVSTLNVGASGSTSAGHRIFTRLYNFVLCPSLSAIVSACAIGFLMNRVIFPTSKDDHDGGHIFDLILEKVSLSGTYGTFHTKLYTCAAEFDFIGWVSLQQPIATGLLPAAGIITLWVLGTFIHQLMYRTAENPEKRSSEISTEPVASNLLSLFMVIQLFFFTIMAVLIMRLKLFWTTHMCLCLALFAQPNRWKRLVTPSRTDTSRSKQNKAIKSARTWIPHAILVALLAFMTQSGVKHLQAELAIRGQFSAYGDEALLQWFTALLPPAADYPEQAWVISGPLSTLGGLRLMLPSAPPYPSTQPRLKAGFSFTNHPHYENAELRRRTVLAYSIYSRRSIAEVWHIYKHDLKANFVIVDTPSCYPRNGCSNPELYNLVDPHLSHERPLCQHLLNPDLVDRGITPPSWQRYFTVVYVDPGNGRVVLFVR